MRKNWIWNLCKTEEYSPENIEERFCCKEIAVSGRNRQRTVLLRETIAIQYAFKNVAS